MLYLDLALFSEDGFSCSPKLIRWIWICEVQENGRFESDSGSQLKIVSDSDPVSTSDFKSNSIFITNMVVIQSQTHFCLWFQFTIRFRFWIRFKLEKDLDPSLWLEFETHKNLGSYNMFWIRSNFLWKSKLSFKPTISYIGEFDIHLQPL